MDEIPDRGRGRKARRSLVHVIISGEEITRRPDFRHYVNDTLRALKCRKNGLFEEIDGNIDAAEGNAVIERCRRSQALRPTVLRRAFYNPMQSDVIFIVHPKKI